jgi:hypothetical protein
MKSKKIHRIQPIRAHVVTLETFMERKKMSHFLKKEKALQDRFAKAMKWHQKRTPEDALV